MRVNVKDGTNAGWRVAKAAPKDYTCNSCGAKVKYYWTRCPVDGCNEPRP